MPTAATLPVIPPFSFKYAETLSLTLNKIKQVRVSCSPHNPEGQECPLVNPPYCNNAESL